MLRRLLPLVAVVCLLSVQLSRSAAQTLVAPPFADYYSTANLQLPAGVPARFGGLVFKQDEPNTLLIAGIANQPNSSIYSVVVKRGAGQHIVGFGAAREWASAPDIDGGLLYVPGSDGTLFYTGFPSDTLGEILPGSRGPNLTVSLSSVGIGYYDSPGVAAFVPEGYPGAGKFKIATYNAGWYDVEVKASGGGLYSLGQAVSTVDLLGGIEGIAFVPHRSPMFPQASVLVAQYLGGQIVAYTVNADGNPELSSARNFVYNITDAQGAVFDPLTGDLLFTQSLTSVIVRVQGFAAPTPASVIGDPLFVGLRGQQYQVHGMSGAVYSLISDSQVQLNSRFVFLSSGECLRDSHGRPLYQCWAHPGSYLSSIGIRLADGSSLLVHAGSAHGGFSNVSIDGQPVRIGYNGSIGQQGMRVQYRSLRQLDITHAGVWSMRIENSDGFLNLLQLSVNDWALLTTQLHSHGLIGQTWSAASDQTNRYHVFEGAVDDYVEANNDLLGCNFLYNRFSC